MYLVINMKNTKYGKGNGTKSSLKNSMMNGNELKSLIILVIIVSVIFLIFYGITLLFDKKETTNENSVVQETIQYDEILVGQVLNRDEKEYYVLIKNEQNHYNDLYLAYLDSYVNADSSRRYYTVDLSNAFNSSYLGDATVIDKTDFYSSKFADTTLIKVKNKKINKTYSTHEDILAILKSIAA